MNNYILDAAKRELLIMLLIILFCIYYKNKIVIITMILLLLILIFFYRGWNNNIEIQNNYLYCPCEGKILNINENKKNIHISIFLNIHNIHVQYAPINGKIKEIKYIKGTFKPAYFFEKSKYNERKITTIESEFGDIKLYQIAGQIARRIKVFKNIGDKINALEPFGLIKFGSRCDLIIPKNNFILNKNLKINQKIRIGDIIGNYNYISI